jgi:4-hydroxy-tetrahydrodipicolinate synthase
MNISLSGVWTAIITPFTETNQLDLDAFRLILADQKAAGIRGVVVCGTTGESPTLSLSEKKLLIQTALQELKGSSLGVLAGTGSNDTQDTVEFSKWASQTGVTGLLLVTPYYNKPTQKGLIDHFSTVADQVDCPIMLYNVPGRTGVSLLPETIVTLARHPKIRAIKEASGNVSLTSDILDLLTSSKLEMTVLSGDDATFLPLLAVGASGVVSVASNLFPRGVQKIYSDFFADRPIAAMKLHQKYYPLFRDLFIESNPGPIKASMAYAGWCNEQLRAPLSQMNPLHLDQLKKSLVQCEIKDQRRQN